ncbi:MAG TPA: GNAT family N-acetyltransferase [Hyphomonadaceae bacterium]|jgi:GNAT superfamily N-acetyltransferase|nr:GNAT family N-acetyltransferase [Hyphomonadaceae bacterium]
MAVVVRALRPGNAEDEAAFRDINLEWIERFFAVEAKDRTVLGDPRKYILDPGGAIFLAVDGADYLGAVALMKMDDACVELAKMGVRPAAQGRGAGRLLVAAAVDHARAMGMKRIYIETNSKLHTAIHLYHAAGFKPLAKPIPSPYARADVQLELFL